MAPIDGFFCLFLFINLMKLCLHSYFLSKIAWDSQVKYFPFTPSISLLTFKVLDMFFKIGCLRYFLQVQSRNKLKYWKSNSFYWSLFQGESLPEKKKRKIQWGKCKLRPTCFNGLILDHFKEQKKKTRQILKRIVMLLRTILLHAMHLLSQIRVSDVWK